MEFVAGLLGSIDDYDSAEKIYRAVVARDPSKSIGIGRLPRHAPRRRRSDDDAGGKLQAGDGRADLREWRLASIRARRDEIGDKYDQQVQQWLDRALLENPDSIPLLMLQAEFDDARKEYD